jgi:hypothetical protein
MTFVETTGTLCSRAPPVLGNFPDTFECNYTRKFQVNLQDRMKDIHQDQKHIYSVTFLTLDGG